MLFSIDICKGALVPGLPPNKSVRTFDALIDIGFFSFFSFYFFLSLLIFVIAFSPNS